MTDAVVQVPPDSTGKMLDSESLTVGSNTVFRQRFELSGTAAAAITAVLNGNPAGTEYGPVVRPIHSAATGTESNVTNAVTNGTALASNTARKGGLFYNDDTAASVYLKFGATASATSFTYKIPPGGLFELPLPIYTGIIDVLATAATGTLRVTELT